MAQYTNLLEGELPLLPMSLLPPPPPPTSYHFLLSQVISEFMDPTHPDTLRTHLINDLGEEN